MGDQGAVSSSHEVKPPREAKSLDEKGWFSTQKRRMKSGRGIDKENDALHQTLYTVREYEAQLHKLQIDLRHMLKAMNACLGRSRAMTDYMVDAFSGPRMIQSSQCETSIQFQMSLTNVHNENVSLVESSADAVFNMILIALVNIKEVKRLSLERKPMLQDKNYYDEKLERYEGDESKREKMERKKVNQREAAQRLSDLEDTYGKLMEDILADKPKLLTSALRAHIEIHRVFYGSIAHVIPDPAVLPMQEPTLRPPEGAKSLA